MAKTRKPDAPPPDRTPDRAPAGTAQEAKAAQAPQEVTPSRDDEVARVAQALAAPFEMAEVKFKPQAVSGSRALAIPYVDARVIQDRLDDVLGVMNWQDSYEVLPDGAVVCRLKLRITGEWITKEDVGGMSEQPDEGDKRKAAFSDALKRAAVKFGLGRYLYRQKPQWCDYDAAKRQFTRQPVLSGVNPQAPKPAAPASQAPPPPQPTADEAASWHRKMIDYEAKLVAQGLCKPGDLVKHVAAAGKKLGYPASFAEWDDEQVQLARDEIKHFVQQHAPKKAS